MRTRALNRISPTKFAKLREPGRHLDGGGLYLQIGHDGARSWIFRFQLSGKVRDMGPGSASIIGLADARTFAAQCRALVARRVDPIEERRRRQQQAAFEAATAVTRTSETIGARWDEIDLEAGRWTIPGARIKAGKTHQIPLSEAALALLRRLQRIRVGEFVFAGLRPGKPLSNMAMLKLLDRMGRRYQITTHGFRSTFRDWAAEQTGHPGEVVEMALAHMIENKVEAAYRRGDLFEKRRLLMRDWGEYCDGRFFTSAVVRLALAS